MPDFIIHQGTLADGQQITVTAFLDKGDNFTVPELTNGQTYAARRLSTPILLEPVAPAPDAVTVTPINAVTMTPLFAGQTREDVEGYILKTEVANFVASDGTIVSTTVTPLGTAGAINSALASGDTAGYRVTVEHSTGQEFVFDTEILPVGFRFEITSLAGNRLQARFNNLVPDGWVETITVSGATGDFAYLNGTYDIEAAWTRQLGPRYLGGAQLSYTALALGDTITVRRGLWLSGRAGSEFFYTYGADGSLLTAPDQDTFVITQEALGTQFTADIRLYDGIDEDVHQIPAISIPAGATANLTGSVLVDLGYEGASSAAFNSTVDISSLSAGDWYVVSVTARDNAPAYTLAITGNAVALNTIAVADNAGQRTFAGLYYGVKGAADSLDLALTFSEAITNGMRVVVYAVGNPGGIIPSAVSAGAGGAASVSLDVNTENPCILIAAGASESVDVTLSGVPSPLIAVGNNANYVAAIGRITTAASPRTVALINTAGHTSGVAAAIRGA